MALWEAEGSASEIHKVDESARFLKLLWEIDSLEEAGSCRDPAILVSHHKCFHKNSVTWALFFSAVLIPDLTTT